MIEYIEELGLHMAGKIITLIEGFDVILMYEDREAMNYLRKKIKHFEGIILHEENMALKEIEQDILTKAKRMLTCISRYKRQDEKIFGTINTFEYSQLQDTKTLELRMVQ